MKKMFGGELARLLESEQIDRETYAKLTRERKLMFWSMAAVILLVGMALVGAVWYVSALAPDQVARVVKWVDRPVVPQVIDIHPDDVVEDELESIQVIFNVPMVEEEKIGELDEDPDISLDPSVSEAVIWHSPYLAEVVVQRRIFPGRLVTLTIPESLRSLEGDNLKQTYTHQFKHRPLTEMSVRRTGSTWRSQPELRLAIRTNVPTDAGDLGRHLSVLNEAGNEIPWEFVNSYSNRTAHTIELRDPELSGQTLTVTISEGLIPSRGDLPLEKALSDEHTVGYLNWRGVRSLSDDQNPYIELNFNHRAVEMTDMDEYISVEGIDNLRVTRGRYGRLELRSDQLEWGETVEVEVREGLRFGFYQLMETETKTVELANARPRVDIMSHRHMIDLAGERILPVRHINADTLHITVYDLYENNLVFFANQFQYATTQTDLFREQQSVTYPLPGEFNEFREDHLDLEELFERELTGPKLIKYTHNKTRRLESRLLFLTELGISVSKGADWSEILVTALEDGQPLRNINVELFDRPNQLLDRGRTGRNGIVRLDHDESEPTVVVARRGEDVNYLIMREGHLDAGHFDVQGEAYPPASQLDASLYGERELYRPGETIRLQGLVRRHDLGTGTGHPVQVRITDPNNNKIYERHQRPDQYGRIDIETRTGFDAMTGNYLARIISPADDRELVRETIQIEEFLPDRLEAEVTALEERVATGETAHFDVKGMFLHGEPAAGNDVQSRYRIVASQYRSDRFPQFRFGDPRIDFRRIERGHDDGTLDEDGKTSFSVDVSDEYRPPSSLELILEASVMDMGARGVTARDRVAVDPYPYYIGLRFREQSPSSVNPGEPFRLSVVAVDPGDNPKTGPELSIDLYELRWQYALHEDNGEVSYSWSRREIPIESFEMTLETLPEEMEMSVPTSGRYRIVVRDQKRGVAASTDFSSGRWWLRTDARRVDFDRVELTTDRDRYQPGDEAVVQLEAPFDGTAYVFVEGEQPEYLKRVEVDDLEASFRVPVRPEYTPNRYIRVYALRGTRTDGHPAFRSMGIVPLMVERPGAQLDIRVDAGEEMIPGQTAEINLDVRDHRGNPVTGRAAVSIVDVGVLQQATSHFLDPYQRFLRQRGLGVDGSDVFSLVKAEQDELPGRALTPPGARMALADEAELPDEVESVEIHADWFPDVEIERGQGRLTYNVPTFSGRLMTRAWVVTDQGAGLGSDQSTVQEPIVVNEILPRAVSPRDWFEIPIQLMNTEDEAQKVRVTLVSEAPISTTPGGHDLELAPGERKQVWFEASVDTGLGNPTLTITVRSDDYEQVKEKILPVRPPVPEIPFTTLKTVAAETEWTYRNLQRFYNSTQSQQFMIASRPQANVLAPLQELIRYPYSIHTNTLVSRAFPQIFLQDILDAADWDRDRQEEIGKNVEQTIQRLLHRSLPDGTFPRYPGHDSRYDYGTVYSAHFLVEAQRAGYGVPELALDRILSHLEAVLESGRTTRYWRYLRSYAAYVLARAGKYHEPVIQQLHDSLNFKDSWLAVMYLRSALVMAGEMDVEEFKTQLPTTAPDLDGVQVSSRWVTGPQRSQAAVLMTLLDVDPDLDEVEALATALMRWLEAQGLDEGPRVRLPHRTGMVTAALGRYFRELSPQDPDFEGWLNIDERRQLHFSHQEDTHLRMAGPVEAVQVTSSGTGQFLFYHNEWGIPLPEFQHEIERNFSISQTIMDADGNRVSPRSLKQGKLYVIESRVRAPQNHEDLYIEDLLPGGLEPENPNLATDVLEVPALNPRGITVHRPQHMEPRDDRVILHFGQSRQSAFRFRYAVRAVASGKYQWPALAGGSVLDAEVAYLEFRDQVVVKGR